MKVGIIGCGLIGRKRADNLVDSQLVAVADPNTDRAHSFKYYNKDLKIFNDWHDLLNENEVETVIVSTPNNLLTPIAIEAIKTKKTCHH